MLGEGNICRRLIIVYGSEFSFKVFDLTLWKNNKFYLFLFTFFLFSIFKKKERLESLFGNSLFPLKVNNELES